MNIKELILKVNKTDINSTLITNIESKYGKLNNDFVKKLISTRVSDNFLESDDILRLLSLNEIISAKEDLSVDFAEMNVIPFFDTGDNNYIVYNYSKNKWMFMNIVDGAMYSEKNNLEDIF